MDKVTFELVSPERLMFSEAVDMVVLPATEGDIGVLPGHSPLITALRPGVISIFAGNQVTRRLFVAGGFIEVTEDRCVVLAEDAQDVASLQADVVDADLRMLGEDLSVARDEQEKARLQDAIAVAQARQQALQAPSYR